MKDLIYDYAIIGAGAAGLHLALAMLEDSWFANKNIFSVKYNVLLLYNNSEQQKRIHL